MRRSSQGAKSPREVPDTVGKHRWTLRIRAVLQMSRVALFRTRCHFTQWTDLSVSERRACRKSHGCFVSACQEWRPLLVFQATTEFVPCMLRVNSRNVARGCHDTARVVRRLLGDIRPEPLINWPPLLSCREPLGLSTMEQKSRGIRNPDSNTRSMYHSLDNVALISTLTLLRL